MKSVFEYLDKNLIRSDCEEFSVNLKANGHYCAHGNWHYPENWHGNMGMDEFHRLSEEERKLYKSPDHVSININNETIIVGNMSIDGEWSRYHYLQTYSHIPRGEPDSYGYYARSTEEEIINYLDYYISRIKARRNEL